MRTLFFQDPARDKDPKAMSAVVPAQGFKLFRGRPDVTLLPRRVLVLGAVDGIEPLKVTALLRSDLQETFGSLAGGEVNFPCQISPAEWIVARVENPSNLACEGHVVILGQCFWPSKDKQPQIDILLGLTPYANPSDPDARRIRVSGPTAVSGLTAVRLDFPFACRPRKITMRSDAPLGVKVTDLRLVNVSLLMGEAVPVAMFLHGQALCMNRVALGNSMVITLANDDHQAHYVEIDLDVELESDPLPLTRSASPP